MTLSKKACCLFLSHFVKPFSWASVRLTDCTIGSTRSPNQSHQIPYHCHWREPDSFTLPLPPNGPHVSGTAPFTTIDELLSLCGLSCWGKWAGYFKHCHHKGRRVPQKRSRSLIIREANDPFSQKAKARLSFKLQVIPALNAWTL